MNYFLTKPINRLNYIFTRPDKWENDPIENARYKLAMWLWFSGAFISITASVILYREQQHLQMLRASFMAVATLSLSIFTLLTGRWKTACHVCVFLITGFIFTNVFFYIRGVNIVTLQYILLVIVYSFYLLGNKWGLIYSLLNIIPITTYLIFHIDTILHPPAPYQGKGVAVLIVFAYNFFSIIFSQYHLGIAFKKNMQDLQEQAGILNTTINDLKVSRDGLRQQDALQKKLISAMSHDIKSPLKYLMITAKSIYKQKVPDYLEESVTAIYSSSLKMFSVTGNLLEYSKLFLDNDQNKEVISLAHVIEEKATIFRQFSGSNEIKIDNQVDAALTIRINRAAINVIIHNLMDNATRYTSNDLVRFSASSFGAEVELIVENNGAPLPNDVQEWCNDPAATSDSGSSGEGLGLPMVKELMKRINGRLHVSSLAGFTQVRLVIPK